MRKKYLIKQFLLIVVYPKQKEAVAISSQESIQLFSKRNIENEFFHTQENLIFHLRVPRIFLFQAAFKLEVFSFISLNSLRTITSIWRERNKIITFQKTNQPTCSYGWGSVPSLSLPPLLPSSAIWLLLSSQLSSLIKMYPEAESQATKTATNHLRSYLENSTCY